MRWPSPSSFHARPGPTARFHAWFPVYCNPRFAGTRWLPFCTSAMSTGGRCRVAAASPYPRGSFSARKPPAVERPSRVRVPSKLWVGGAACAGRAKALSGTVSSAVPPASWPAVSSVRFTSPLPVSGSPGTGAVAAGAAIVGGGTANSPASTAATAAARRSRRVWNGLGMVRGPLGLAADAGYRRMVRCAGAAVQCLPDLVRLPAEAYLQLSGACRPSGGRAITLRVVVRAVVCSRRCSS